MKHVFRASGNFQTSSTSGFGYVSFAPFNAAYFHGTTTHGPVNWSDSTFVGSAISTALVAVTGQNFASLNSPYSSGNAGDQTQARLVAAGLRVRNTTPLLSKGGSLIGLESPGHLDLGGETFTTCLLVDTCERCDAFSNDWIGVTYHPLYPNEITYFPAAASDQNPYMNDILAFCAQAPATGTAQLYEWETYGVYEFMGELVHGLSPSMSDPIGFAKVQNMYSTPASRKPVKQDFQWFATMVGTTAGLASTAYEAYKRTRGRAPGVTDIRRGPVIEEMP